MRISTLIYCTKEGMRNIIRNIWFSLASVAIISACIFLFCMFFGLIANVQYMVRNAESTVGITVFFNEYAPAMRSRKQSMFLPRRHGRILRKNILRESRIWQKDLRMTTR